MTDVILSLNAGSTSLRFTLFELDSAQVAERPLADGEVEGLGGQARLRIASRIGAGVDQELAGGADHAAALQRVLGWIDEHDAGMRLLGVGHRIVHGGTQFQAPCRLSPRVVDALEALTPLAPLHQPHNLAAVRALARSHPRLPQVGCFDTAFHATNTPLSTRYALPRELRELGLRRYGFHGLSYEYIASILPRHLGERADGRVVVAHLGGGASLCAMRARRSVTSTMGFSALEGLPMTTRAGHVDPGVLLYLMSERGMDAAALGDLLYHRSGLLGLSGFSGDMRTLLASSEPRAAMAVQTFVYAIGRELGSLAAALGGLDALVFTGGIGEHAAAVREQVCRDAAWLGLRLDAAANTAGGPLLSEPGSPVTALALATNEELMIARHTLAVARGASA